jgi:hypothetical protein
MAAIMTGTADVVKTTAGRPRHRRITRCESGLDHLPQRVIHCRDMTAFDELGTEARDCGGRRSRPPLHARARRADERRGRDRRPAPSPLQPGDRRARRRRRARLGRRRRADLRRRRHLGRLAALDAVECEPDVLRPVTGRGRAERGREDDRDGGAARSRRSASSEADASSASAPAAGRRGSSARSKRHGRAAR